MMIPPSVQDAVSIVTVASLIVMQPRRRSIESDSAENDSRNKRRDHDYLAQTRRKGSRARSRWLCARSVFHLSTLSLIQITLGKPCHTAKKLTTMLDCGGMQIRQQVGTNPSFTASALRGLKRTPIGGVAGLDDPRDSDLMVHNRGNRGGLL